MDKKYITTLSNNELQVLEALIMDHGNLVDFAMICEKMGKKKESTRDKKFYL